VGTKKTSTTTNAYDPASMNRYQSWAGGMLPQLQGLFNNPTGSPFFNFNLQQGQRTASGLSGRNNFNALQNFNRSGIGGGSLGSGARMQMFGDLGRQASNLGYQGWAGAMGQAQSDRWNAAQLGAGMFANPLQTGQNNVQQTSGLGTWLPQLAGAALGGLSGLGGLGSLFGGGGAGGGGGFTNAGAPGMLTMGGSTGNPFNGGFGNSNSYFGNNPLSGGNGYTGGGINPSYNFGGSMGPNPFNMSIPGMPGFGGTP
jgi:hypothetical protein